MLRQMTTSLFSKLNPEDLEKAFENAPKQLICEACYAPSDDWVVVCGNNHSFCNPCIEKHVAVQRRDRGSTNCPTCRQGLQRNGAGVFNPDRTKNELTLCQTMACPLGCGHDFQLIKLVEHMESECPKKVVPCPFHEYGCKASMARENVEEHLRTDDHTGIAMAFFFMSSKDNEMRINQYQAETDSLKQIIRTQTDTIANMQTALASQTSATTDLSTHIQTLSSAQVRIERKLDEVLSDGPHSLKAIAEQTKKRARVGEGVSGRAQRRYNQIDKLKGEVVELKSKLPELPDEEAAAEDGGEPEAEAETEACANGGEE